jgi:hypothetical protein
MVAAAVLLVTFLIIYLPDIGHGLIKDDFTWIHNAQAASVSQLLTGSTGFYRPLVSLSFVADYAVWSDNPFGYGLTNLLLSLGDAALLFALARALKLPIAAALLAAAVWLFNVHGINMALLWLSGRTSLLVTMCALATTLAVVHRRWFVAGGFCLAALLCKEEAVMLPALLTAFIAWTDREARSTRSTRSGRAGASISPRRVIARTWPLWAALAVYLVLRAQSTAFGPLEAPQYYRLSTSPPLIARNVAEYADRAGTLAAAVTIVLLLFARKAPTPFSDEERTALLCAALWIPAMYAVTVLVPVRSTLYAVLPSIGSALAAAAVGSAIRRQRPDAFKKAATALVVLALILIPVYRQRNGRWVTLADLSTRVMARLESDSRGSSGGRVVLIDDVNDGVNLAAAIGSGLPDALALSMGPDWTGEIVDVAPAYADDATLVYALSRGRLEAR